MDEPIFCGARLAPSCAACGVAADAVTDAGGSCIGDCTSLADGRCVPIDPGHVAEPSFMTPPHAWLFDPAQHALRIVDAGSPLSAAALTLLAASSLPRADGAGGCRLRPGVIGPTTHHGAAAAGGSGSSSGGDECVPAARPLELSWIIRLANSSAAPQSMPRCDCPSRHHPSGSIHQGRPLAQASPINPCPSTVLPFTSLARSVSSRALS